MREEAAKSVAALLPCMGNGAACGEASHELRQRLLGELRGAAPDQAIASSGTPGRAAAQCGGQLRTPRAGVTPVIDMRVRPASMSTLGLTPPRDFLEVLESHASWGWPC